MGLLLVTGCAFQQGGSAGGMRDGDPGPDAVKGDGPAGPDAGGSCSAGALDFAPRDWIEVGDASLDLTNDFTVQAWVEPRAISAEYHIASRHDHGASEGWVLMIKDRVPEFRVYFADDQGPSSHCDCKNPDQALVADRWVHIAGSFLDGTGYLFKDGVLIEICDCAELCGGCGGPTAAPYGGPLAIGIESSSLDRYAVDGLIDEVHVLGAARTASFEPLAASDCSGDSLLLFPFDRPVGQELTSACDAAPTGQLGSDPGADENDPTPVELECAPR